MGTDRHGWDAERVRVRRARRSDLDLVLSAADLLTERPTPEWTADFLGRGSNHLMLALDPGPGDPDATDAPPLPVGVLLAVETGHPGASPDLFVYSIVVREGYRDAGIAHRLVTKAVEIAEESGCGRVWGSLLDGPTTPITSPHSPPDSVMSQALTFVIPIP